MCDNYYHILQEFINLLTKFTFMSDDLITIDKILSKDEYTSKEIDWIYSRMTLDELKKFRDELKQYQKKLQDNLNSQRSNLKHLRYTLDEYNKKKEELLNQAMKYSKVQRSTLVNLSHYMIDCRRVYIKIETQKKVIKTMLNKFNKVNIEIRLLDRNLQVKSSKGETQNGRV